MAGPQQERRSASAEPERWPETTTDVPVGAVRVIEVVADAPGDWAFHCHKSHHIMNAMGHNTRNFIGANQKELAKAVRRLVPDFHPMGSEGIAMMGAMEHPMPDNTLPMMTGFGQFGPIEMGGMFTLMKTRAGLTVGDYGDPGPYKHPEGTVAYEFTGTGSEPPRRSDNSPVNSRGAGVPAVKPGSKPIRSAQH